MVLRNLNAVFLMLFFTLTSFGSQDKIDPTKYSTKAFSILGVGMVEDQPRAVLLEKNKKQSKLWLLNITDQTKKEIPQKLEKDEINQLTSLKFNQSYCDNADQIYAYNHGSSFISINLSNGLLTRFPMQSFGSSPHKAVLTEVDGQCQVFIYRWKKTPLFFIDTGFTVEQLTLQGKKVKEFNHNDSSSEEKGVTQFHSVATFSTPSYFETSYKSDTEQKNIKNPKLSLYDLLTGKKLWTTSLPLTKQKECYTMQPIVSSDQKTAAYSCSDIEKNEGPVEVVIIDLKDGKIIKHVVTEKQLGMLQFMGGYFGIYQNGEPKGIFAIGGGQPQDLTTYTWNSKKKDFEKSASKFRKPFALRDLKSNANLQIYDFTGRDVLSSIDIETGSIQNKYELQKTDKNISRLSDPYVILRGNKIIVGANYEDMESSSTLSTIDVFNVQ